MQTYFLTAAQIGLPAVIALAALAITAWIQTGHARVVRTRLKLDLFEKRYEFLQLIRAISAISLAHDGRYFDKVQREYGKFRQYKLLFPEAIGLVVDDLIRLCDELWLVSETLKLEPAGTAELEREQQKTTALRERIRDAMEALERRIEDFIRIDWKG